MAERWSVAPATIKDANTGVELTFKHFETSPCVYLDIVTPEGRSSTVCFVRGGEVLSIAANAVIELVMTIG